MGPQSSNQIIPCVWNLHPKSRRHKTLNLKSKRTYLKYTREDTIEAGCAWTPPTSALLYKHQMRAAVTPRPWMFIYILFTSLYVSPGLRKYPTGHLIRLLSALQNALVNVHTTGMCGNWFGGIRRLSIDPHSQAEEISHLLTYVRVKGSACETVCEIPAQDSLPGQVITEYHFLWLWKPIFWVSGPHQRPDWVLKGGFLEHTFAPLASDTMGPNATKRGGSGTRDFAGKRCDIRWKSTTHPSQAEEDTGRTAIKRGNAGFLCFWLDFT